MSTKPTVLVIGGSGTVGSEICMQLAGRGLTVYGTYKREGLNPGTRWLRWRVGEKFTPGPALSGSDLQAVFYCVGTASSKSKLLETSLGEVTDLYAINASGLVAVLGALKDTIRRCATSIVAISSDATTTTRALNGPYTASKVALEVFARTIAIEEQENGVRVNVVCPSLIDSAMGDLSLKRAGIADIEAHKKGLPGGKALSARDVAQAAISVAFDPQWRPCSGQVFRIGAPPR